MSLVLSILALSTQDALDRFPRYSSMSEVTEIAVVRYWHCVSSEANRLSNSVEGAETVAVAAFASCNKQRIDVSSMIAIDVSRDDLAPQVDINGLLNGFDRKMKAAAVLQVIERRLANGNRDAPNP